MVDLADVERPLALFAEGIAGRYCHLKVGDEDAADRGGVYLPATIDLFEDEALNSAIYRLRVLVQLGFREFGTFAFDIHRARARIPALAARPLPSAHRESDLTVFFNHFDTPACGPNAVPRDRVGPGRGADLAQVPGRAQVPGSACTASRCAH